MLTCGYCVRTHAPMGCLWQVFSWDIPIGFCIWFLCPIVNLRRYVTVSLALSFRTLFVRLVRTDLAWCLYGYDSVVMHRLDGFGTRIRLTSSLWRGCFQLLLRGTLNLRTLQFLRWCLRAAYPIILVHSNLTDIFRFRRLALRKWLLLAAAISCPKTISDLDWPIVLLLCVACLLLVDCTCFVF